MLLNTRPFIRADVLKDVHKRKEQNNETPEENTRQKETPERQNTTIGASRKKPKQLIFFLVFFSRVQTTIKDFNL